MHHRRACRGQPPPPREANMQNFDIAGALAFSTIAIVLVLVIIS